MLISASPLKQHSFLHLCRLEVTMPGSQLSDQEIAYIKQWRFDEGDSLTPVTIARRLGRNKSTITRHIGKKSAGKWEKGVEKGRRGPARKLTEATVASLSRKLNTLVKKAKGCDEVTATMLKKSSRVKVCRQLMMKRLREQTGFSGPLWASVGFLGPLWAYLGVSRPL